MDSTSQRIEITDFSPSQDVLYIGSSAGVAGLGPLSAQSHVTTKGVEIDFSLGAVVTLDGLTSVSQLTTADTAYFQGAWTPPSGVATISSGGSSSTTVAPPSTTVVPKTYVTGTSGNDTLVGTSGNDVFYGGAGNDTSTGNGGHDVFIFDSQTQHAVITDYSATSDTLYLGSGTGVTTLTAFLADAKAVTGGVEVDLPSGAVLVLDGATLSSLATASIGFFQGDYTLSSSTAPSSGSSSSTTTTAPQTVLYGVQGDSMLVAHNPNTTFYAYSGQDTFTGAGGSNVYVFDGNTHGATVTNFNPTLDKVYIGSDTGLTSTTAVLAASHAVSGGVEIDVPDGAVITLDGASLTALAADLTVAPGPLTTLPTNFGSAASASSSSSTSSGSSSAPATAPQTLYGTSVAPQETGHSASTIFFAYSGQDVFTGDGGNNTYVFDGHTQGATVTNFNAAADHVYVGTDTGLTTTTAILAVAHDVANGVEIDLPSGVVITLDGASLSQMNSTNLSVAQGPLTTPPSGAAPAQALAAPAGTNNPTLAYAASGNQAITPTSQAIQVSDPSTSYAVDSGSGPTTLVATAGQDAGLSVNLSQVQEISFSDKTVFVAHDAQTAQVARLYEATLGRLPDLAGLQAWTGAYEAVAPASVQGTSGGLAANAVVGDFLASPEYQQKYGTNLTDQQFVTALYANVLGRAPDPTGVQNWMSDLASGDTRANVVVEFSESAENVGLVAFTTAHQSGWLLNA